MFFLFGLDQSRRTIGYDGLKMVALVEPPFLDGPCILTRLCCLGMVEEPSTAFMDPHLVVWMSLFHFPSCLRATLIRGE